MPILAFALIFWIAAGCLGAGYLANAYRDNVDAVQMLAVYVHAEKARLDVVETVADYAKDNARAAKKAAEAAQKTIDDHVEWVFRQRALNEKAALQASKPRRKVYARDR